MSLELILLALRLLAVAALYAFLIVIIYIIWRDLRTTTATGGMAAPAGCLRVIGSGEAPLGPGDTFSLHVHTTLGRAPDNLIVLPDSYASAHHARLDRRRGEWWLTDMDSRNGTRLNDVPITKPVPLADGDLIGIGQVTLKLEIQD